MRLMKLSQSKCMIRVYINDGAKLNEYSLCETIFDRTKIRMAVGAPLLYSPNAKDPQKRVIYHRVVKILKEDKAISKIAKEVNITRQTVYRIKLDKGLY
jgi:hypothetical protein